MSYTNLTLDVIGRRPVILVGVVGLALATFVFGLSKSFVAVLITRCLGMLFSTLICLTPQALSSIWTDLLMIQ
jgi:MFS family permease